MDFEKISIRGRFCYGLLCIERYVNQYSIFSNAGELIKQKYAEFTIRNDLDNWYDECKEYTPAYYIHSPTLPAFHRLKEANIVTIRQYYESISNDLISIWSLVFDIGSAHLYSRIYGNSTQLMLEEIIRILDKEKINLPNIDRVSFSSFSEKNGWGNEFDWNNI